jgi:adenine-specific DNA-methyltransferase
MERETGWSLGTPALEILRAGKALTGRRAQQFVGKRRTAFAAALATRMVLRYWEAIQAGYEKVWPLRSPPVELVHPILGGETIWLAETIGRAAANVDPLSAAFFIGTTYAAALPPDVRARFGVYYTPPALATRLLDQISDAAVDWNTCTVLDPACGGGAFLAPVAQRIVKQLSHLEPEALYEAIGSRVRGLEIDPIAAWMSQVFLETTLMPTCRAVGRRLPQVVEVCDALQRSPGPRRFDVVVGNPPYGRVTLPPNLRTLYSRSLYGHANLYGLFTDLAVQWVKPGGVVAYVTPTSFLGGEYFKNLRALLGREAPPVCIDFITHRKGIFDDVLQEALLATYRRGAEAADATVHSVTPLDEGTMQIVGVGSFALPDAPEEPWLIPRSTGQARLIERLHRMPQRLAHWGYRVSTGPLVWNRHKAQLRIGPGHGHLPLVWAEAVTSDGRFALRATKPNHQPFFKPQRGDDWLVTRRPCVLVQRTTAKEQSRRVIAAVLPVRVLRDHGGVVIENHLNMIRPLV